MELSELIFYILAFIGIVAALVTVTANNPIYSILGLIVCFFTISAHFVLMNAQFLAMVNIIVYAGAIIVLFLFVVMMMNLNDLPRSNTHIIWKISGAIGAGALMLLLVASLKVSGNLVQSPTKGDIGLIHSLGHALMNEFLVPFIMTSILLNSAMIGAVLLSKREKQLQK
ncbi:MAG: NADH-quinone oxidoreductase subunit J [Chitinophagales bacterium]|nr:NADH-quinone oxidoreductase subunit J [Chitinophagales bacterium]MCZ2392270.1 NADH-quinone oxidoreductase subunit J [Chitinophagales bacterium]